MAVDPWAGFERDLALITADADRAAIKRDFVAFAKQSLADVISSGEASPIYDRYVNGRPNLPEEAVQLPGLIVYEFVNWPLVINAALAELERRAPRKSGRFASSFIVIVGERIVTDYTKIPNDPKTEVIITNAQPYIRKVEGGVLSPPRNYVFDGTRRAMASRFAGSFNFVTRWLNIGQGVDSRIPYILRGGRDTSIAALAEWHGVPSQVIQGWRARGKTISGPPTQSRRKGRQAGDSISYPAVIINMS